ncbi:LysR family transcriptional regulator [Tateyamaria omphalii]|uniref:LysR family transcriptional regulator n=1 Tax=Tateyamaria omphalii TaxID=299262 RepID=UPI001C998AF3|nr:LysR family transcriptional regulator [Tateyamaria omphalii]MBY5931454.1 LysR family transcriptional regulator [Tateyamaria omphalii]
MKLDPKHLAQLSVIVETGSFQAAADRLGLTQPALSRNMKALEVRLGATLFNRDGRKSIPNALGLRLSRNGQAIRLAEEQASVLADQSAKGAVGELRIGAPPIVAGRFLSTSIARFIRENPNCVVEMRTGLVHELRTMLEQGQVDFVLGPQSLADPSDGLDFEPLIDDRVGILCRTGHPLTARKNVMASDLEAQVWLAHSRGSLLRQQTEAAMTASGVKSMHIVCETDSIRSVLEIVGDTDLITTMPRATTASYLEDKLVFLDFDHPRFHRPLGVIRQTKSSSNPMEVRFLSTLV